MHQNIGFYKIHKSQVIHYEIVQEINTIVSEFINP